MKYEQLINDYVLNKNLNPAAAKHAIAQMIEFEQTSPAYAGRHYYYSAQFYYEQAELKKSMDNAVAGIRAMIHMPYTIELVKCYNLMGAIYDAKGNNKLQALDYYLEALDLAESHQDLKTASSLYNNIGCLYDSLSDQQNAIYFFMKAFELYQDDKNNDLYMMEALNLALMYCDMKDWERTYYYYNRACECINPSAVKVNETHLLLIQCLIAHHKREYDKVQQLFRTITENAKTKTIAINGFQEIIRQLPKLLDLHYEEEIKELLIILENMADQLDFINMKIKVIEIKIEFSKLSGNTALISELSVAFYELWKKNYQEHMDMLIDGMYMKLQMRSLVKEHKEMKEVSKTYKEQAERDALTKIYNRIFLDNTVQPRFTRAVQHGEIIGVAIFDVNDFKQYNDCYGHVAGDYCIRNIGSILLKHCNQKTYFVRYGGDEFLGLFFEQNAQEIEHMIQLIYAEVKALNIHHEAATTDEKFLSVTAGAYISIPPKNETLYHYIDRADHQLYSGKKQDKAIKIKSAL